MEVGGANARIGLNIMKWSNIEFSTIDEEYKPLLDKKDEKKNFAWIFLNTLEFGFVEDWICKNGEYWKEPRIERDKRVRLCISYKKNKKKEIMLLIIFFGISKKLHFSDKMLSIFFS